MSEPIISYEPDSIYTAPNYVTDQTVNDAKSVLLDFYSQFYQPTRTDLDSSSPLGQSMGVTGTLGSASKLDFFAQGQNPIVTYTYTQNFGGAKFLEDTAEYFDKNAASYPNPPNFSDQEGQHLLAQWDAIWIREGLTKPQELNTLPSMGELMKVLLAQNLVTIEANPVHQTTPEESFNAFLTHLFSTRTLDDIWNFAAQFQNRFTRSLLADLVHYPEGAKIYFVNKEGKGSFTYDAVGDTLIPLPPSNKWTENTVDDQSLRNVIRIHLEQFARDTLQEEVGKSSSVAGALVSSLNITQQNSIINQVAGLFFTHLQTELHKDFKVIDPIAEWTASIAPLFFVALPFSELDVDAFETYKTIHDTFFPNNPESFLVNLQAFGNQQIRNYTGAETASDFVKSWLDFTIEKSGGYLPQSTGLEEAGFDQVQLLFDIYDLIVAMLFEMHALSAAQTERQGYLAEHQGAYNALLGILVETYPTEKQWHIGDYVPETDTPLSTNERTDNQRRRGDVQALITQYSEQLRSYRSEISDLSKQQNTAVNQSTESVSQQLNIAGSIIQQFGSLLSSIWR